MSFSLLKAIDANKVFLTRKSEVSNRWDPFYFIPSIVALEKNIRKVTPYRLRDFVLQMAGGATPPTSEAETHYTESSDGIPFIRVQNLSTTGKVNLEDCKRITRSTHEGLLARSKLSGGELLVKITGVGRMAVASVVPENFEGNINQHIVLIRTQNIHTSETLAAYLNLDIAERLASRRATGGTRPALDYPALLSIPVIHDNRIPKLLNRAIHQFEVKRNSAEYLLQQVYEDVQVELGISVDSDSNDSTDVSTSIIPTIFLARRSEITDRLDPEMILFRRQTHSFKYPTYKLRRLIKDPPQYGAGERGLERTAIDQPRYVRITDIDDWGYLTNKLGATASKIELRYTLEEDDLLIARSGNTVGKSYLHKKKYAPYPCFYAGYLIRFRLNKEFVLPSYVSAFLRLPIYKKWVKAVQRPAGQPNINAQEYLSLTIPVPPRSVQEKIVEIVEKGRREALELKHTAGLELAEAKKEIESMILGEVATHEA